MSLSAARIRILESQQSGIARKVLSAVPFTEPWSHQQIAQELFRSHGLREMNAIMGCLRSLCNDGLIKEMQTMWFQRVKPREEKPEMPVNTPAPQPVKKSAQDKLIDLATQLRAVSKSMANVADDIDTLALELDEKRESNEQELESLRAMQRALRGALGINAP